MNKNPNHNFAFALFCLLVSMLLLSFASSPLYDLFCKATGFGGTTQRSDQHYNNHQLGTKQIIVEFDSNVEKGMPWRFIPKHRKVQVRTGENTMIFYEAENLSDHDIIGTSVYNVTPAKAGQYFVKIQCFCFEEQLLKAGAKMLMPVSFFIDPAIETNPDTQHIDQITLSYTFFRVKN
jgi:cytochrome c oxidase assembly protein subunit 11